MAQVGTDQYAFDFSDEVCGNAPHVNWYPYVEGSATLLVTQDETLQVTATSGDVWASCWPATSALGNTNEVDVVQRFRFTGNSEFEVIIYIDDGNDTWQA